ncbi:MULTISPECIES: hypothetical protein [unclassified Sphingopyxis]|uniref:hypothetical protein n=1 Tax=unclassified Sphingopyxis TaxID=2614943 RepID=UPI0012E3E898|nr:MULTISPECIES: hypothetical protein [unclassified Sphingopyxis]
MKEWWAKRTGGERVSIIIATPGLLLMVAGLVIGSLRYVGILPPAPPVHITPYAERPKFDRVQCWRDETEKRYGYGASFPELDEDARFRIIRECSYQRDEFYGVR